VQLILNGDARPVAHSQAAAVAQFTIAAVFVQLLPRIAIAYHIGPYDSYVLGEYVLLLHSACLKRLWCATVVQGCQPADGLYVIRL
jgi:hypothetical protein